MKLMVGQKVYLVKSPEQSGTVSRLNPYSNKVDVVWDVDGKTNVHHINELMTEASHRDMKRNEHLRQIALKPEEVTVGSTVYLIRDTAPLPKGKIMGPLDNSQGNNLVIVEWEGGHLTKSQITTLLSEGYGSIENDHMLAHQQRLEEEFAKVEEECAAKLSEAGKLVREAARYAAEHGKDLMEMYDATSELIRAMRDAGWRTSSLSC